MFSRREQNKETKSNELTLLTTKKSSYTFPLGNTMPPAFVTASGKIA